MTPEYMIPLVVSALGTIASAYFLYLGNKPKVQAEAEGTRVANLDRLWDQVQEISAAYFRAVNDISALKTAIQRNKEEHAEEIKKLKQQLEAERRAREVLQRTADKLSRDLDTERDARIKLEAELKKRDERIKELEEQIQQKESK